jgi:mono/diheme cytochrome c family protein
MGASLDGVRCARRIIAAIGSLGIALLAALSLAAVLPRQAMAGWPWIEKHNHPVCGHPVCGPHRCLAPYGWAGQWYWMRSPDQEQRVVMGLYNRYCIRCHGVDGRGVCAVPDVPDFTDPRWQKSRPDQQIVTILMEGRGAVMPTFRGTLSLEEAWAMARHLRSFVPGTAVARPEVGGGAAAKPARNGSQSAAANDEKVTIPPPLPVAGRLINP